MDKRLEAPTELRDIALGLYLTKTLKNAKLKYKPKTCSTLLSPQNLLKLLARTQKLLCINITHQLIFVKGFIKQC